MRQTCWERLCAEEDTSGSLHAHSLFIENTQRNSFNTAFMLKAIELAFIEGKRATAHKFDMF